MSNADNTPLPADDAGESLLERALRDGGDVPRDPNAPNGEQLALVAAAAKRDAAITYHGPCNSGAYDAGDVFERFWEAKYGC